MRSTDNIAEELFDKIRSRVANVKLGDENGAVTTNSSQARFFEFNFKHRDLPVGAVTISLNEEGVLQVYFPNSMVEEADSSTADAWYGFLKELSRFSARNMLNYESHNVTKERLDKKDYQFLTQRNQDEVMENRLHGTSQKSFLETGTAKLIIKHNGTVDETKMGARSRNISAIYIENSEGERFKFANNYLPGARAMARHVSNEGHTRDDRGMHIVEIMKEMTDLKTFVRSVKREEYVNEDAQEVIDAATDRYYGLKDTLKAISSAKGYGDYFENWVPGAVEVDENDIDDLKQKLTREVYDERLTDSLASVRRAMDYKANMEAKGSDEEEMDAPIKPYFDRSIDPQEPKNLDAKADANTAKGSQSLNDIADSNDDIEVYNNEADIAELKNYMQFMKNSDMEVGKKNRSILVAIMKYLSNNMTNDAAANTASEIELSDPAQQATALKLAKKYLQNKIEILQPKAKKDLYGKDKTEDTTFEAYAQRMDMISEGTWALPENEGDAMKLAAMMSNPIALGDGGDDAANALGGLIGDDELFDDLGVAGDKDPEGDARPIIIGWMMEHVADYGPDYRENMGRALAKIRAMGVDSDMVIPRTFGARQDRGMSKQQADDAYNTSATQGERMGSNADDMKEDPNEGNEFSGALAKAKEEGKEEFEVDGKVYKVSEAEVEEGRMSDLSQEIDEVIADMEADMELFPFTNEFRNEVMKSYNIKAALEKVLPDYVAGSKIRKLVGEEVEVDEAADMIAKMKSMAGVGSGTRSNHGIHEGEQGYQLTPRSIVARELRKLQDIERSS
tara:strand:- start:1663 stop:4041 length:2379 start_codon:yes stop_codon:yes gene_type:complete